MPKYRTYLTYAGAYRYLAKLKKIYPSKIFEVRSAPIDPFRYAVAVFFEGAVEGKDFWAYCE